MSIKNFNIHRARARTAVPLLMVDPTNSSGGRHTAVNGLISDPESGNGRRSRFYRRVEEGINVLNWSGDGGGGDWVGAGNAGEVHGVAELVG